MPLTDTDLYKIGELIDDKLDKCFAEYDEKMDKKLDKRFAERDKKLDRRFEQHTKELMTFMLEHFPTKQEMNDKIDEAKNELREEFRVRFTRIEDSIVKFQQQWELGEPIVVGKRLNDHDKAIASIDRRVTVLET